VLHYVSAASGLEAQALIHFLAGRELTRSVQQIGESLELTLIDHIIVTANNGTSSFRTAGWL
jgi:hypothetical protein